MKATDEDISAWSNATAPSDVDAIKDDPNSHTERMVLKDEPRSDSAPVKQQSGSAMASLRPEHDVRVPSHANGNSAAHSMECGLSSSPSGNVSGDTVTPAHMVNGSAAPPDSTPKAKRGKPKKKNKNYAVIHSKPLPLEIYQLPAFHPTNPISLLKLCYVWLSQILSPPSSHSPTRYQGYFSPETRSVHVTDPVHIRALWEMGFFGKGTLSRSEPSWLDRAKAKAQELRNGGTAEEATNARREERRLFKLERARLEREKIDMQRAVEEGRMTVEEAAAIDAALEEKDEKAPEQSAGPASARRLVNPPAPTAPPTDDILEHLDIANQEHLQLTLEEAFFLSYGLGVLHISTLESSPSSSHLLNLFAAHATFPPSHLRSIPPDNSFLLNYVVYHHFRSLGWVVRSGLKFSCDYLLYQRGPVFSHAEFALLIIPSYSDAYWKTESGNKERRWKEKDWWWLHCVNRVQSQVKKTLVLVYVDVPAPREWSEGGNVGELLRGYKVREFVVRRWIANRSRD